MKLRITKRQSEYLGQEDLDELNIGIDRNRWSWQTEQFVDLSKMSGKQLDGFVALLEANKTVRGLGAMYRDVTTWKQSFEITAIDNSTKATNCQHFCTLAKKVIGELPHHYLFKLASEVPGVYHPYYVSNIEFHPKRRVKDGDGGYYVIPEHTDITMEWSENGGKNGTTIVLHKKEVQFLPVKTILANEGYILEDEKNYEFYAKELNGYMEMVGQIGKQFNAFGVADLFVDRSESRRGRHAWWDDDGKAGEYIMERDGEPSKVVVDVFTESEKSESCNYGVMSHADEKFWLSDQIIKKNLASDEDVTDETLEDDVDALEENRETRPKIPLPHHLYLVVFDMKRHMRFSIHKANLEEYKYNRDLGSNLILPEDTKVLVTLLTDHRNAEFNDIIKGKSGGSIVALCGEPGTGKTLTAEVLAEVEEKALYSVQASQLGTSEAELEKNLMKALGRAKRWGAIMLLDESDVYIRQRGSDIHQNAIVGVFLRVLEYYTSVLFLTTNRPDDIDDAVASRCIAKITYEAFQEEGIKANAWKTLSKVAGIELDEEEITKLSQDGKRITGRDIKNLLKLAKLYTKAKGEKITAETIEFLRRFKPTA